MVWVKVGRKMGGYTSALKSKSLSPMASERTWKCFVPHVGCCVLHVGCVFVPQQ